MIKSVQSSEKIMAQPIKNFKGAEDTPRRSSAAKMSQLQAAETKYTLACLLAATTQLENQRLKQELANTAAIANYYKCCG